MTNDHNLLNLNETKRKTKSVDRGNVPNIIRLLNKPKQKSNITVEPFKEKQRRIRVATLFGRPQSIC